MQGAGSLTNIITGINSRQVMLSKEEFDNSAQSSKVKYLKGHKKGEVQKKNCQDEVIEQIPHNIFLYIFIVGLATGTTIPQ